jgi:cyclic pyranopterin phosphate synthase
MIDRCGRTIEYLRLSVTDRCNYRCIYCMSEDGVEKRDHADILSIEELAAIAEAACMLGIRKIRLTGGEPLVRKGILHLCEKIKKIDSNIELSMTTNGSLLKDMAADLKAAGLDRLNISLDTLDKDTFRAITRRGNLDDVLAGLDAAEKAGFKNTKLNAVLIGGLNESDVPDLIRMTRDREIGVRFIELMPLGVAADWEKERFVSCELVGRLLQSAAEMIRYDGVARIYRLPEHKGTVGLISPLSRSFCDRCNKIRVTADGRLKPCLHTDTEIPLRGLRGEALIAALRDGINQKPPHHTLGGCHSGTSRMMNEIGG